MDEISIVMATYNGASYLEEQIDSLLQNTITNWKLQICDDGSTDRTIDIARAYVEQYPDKISLVQNREQLGVTLNFLSGAKRAEGDYIMCCDQDDVWLPDKIEKTLQKMKEQEKQSGTQCPIAVFTDAKLVNSVLQTIGDSFFACNGLNTEHVDLPHLLMENKLLGCTVMFNRALAEKLVKLPAMARYHDWWIGLIAATFGKVVYLDEATLLYRQHGGNVVGAQNFFQYIVGRVKSLQEQKESLVACQRQAGEFYEIYKEHLLEEQKQIIWDFANLQGVNWLEKRDRLFRYGFWKSGKLRNIGVFLLI